MSKLRALPTGAQLTMTYRFDNLLSSKAGPNGTQALLWDGNNIASGTGAASVALPANAAVSFLGTDIATQGNWKSVYGADGYNIIQDAVSYPSYATVSETGTSNNTWSTSTTDVRALEQTITGRIAADWNSATNFTVDINLTDGNAHKVSIYCLDWDTSTRAQTVEVQDANYGTVLNSQTISSFNGGIYLTWTIQGHVKLVFTNTGTPNAVVSGLFFDSFPSPPTGGQGIIMAGAGLTRNVGVDANGNPVVRQFHTDGQGSVLAITDGAGNLVTGYQIDAWGNVLSGSSPGNTFEYLGGLGYWADPDLGLSYARARWMNPATGSWLSVDPMLDQFAYQYANNMPTTETDASGMDVDSDKAREVLKIPRVVDLSADQIRLLLRVDAKHKLPQRLSAEGRRLLNWLLQHQDAIRSAEAQISAQDPHAGAQQGGAPPQLRNNRPLPGHPGAPAGQRNGGPQAPAVLTPDEKQLLNWAYVDYSHPQDPSAQRIVARIGQLNAHHGDINNLMDLEARAIQESLIYRRTLRDANSMERAGLAVKLFYSDLNLHVPVVFQNPFRSDPLFGPMTRREVGHAIATGAVANLDVFTHGNADFFGVDIDYWKRQEGFEGAALLSATGREALLFALPVEKLFAGAVYGTRALSMAHFGADALEATRPATELAGNFLSHNAGKVGARLAGSGAMRAGTNALRRGASRAGDNAGFGVRGILGMTDRIPVGPGSAALRAAYIAEARSPGFATKLAIMNKGVGMFNSKAVPVTVEDIVRVLEDTEQSAFVDVGKVGTSTIHRLRKPPLTWDPMRQAYEGDAFYLFGGAAKTRNPLSTYLNRTTMDHEMLHLGQFLRTPNLATVGPAKLFHELGPAFIGTPAVYGVPSGLTLTEIYYLKRKYWDLR